MSLLFKIEKLRCSYEIPYREDTSRVVLEIESLKIEKGQIVFIVGESGIGKSTILETLGMMNNTIVADSSTRFAYYDVNENEIDLAKMWRDDDNVLSRFRLNNYSFIFQSTNLMRNFTVYENVAYTRMLQGYSKDECFERTRQVLDVLGLGHIGEQRMTQELSGGQQQRLAFARAVLPDYSVLFGDEPTGNLDPENAMKVMRMLEQQSKESANSSAIIVSHDMHLATTFANTIIKIQKRTEPRKTTDDEEKTYGYIDDSCVFSPNESRTIWHGNGISMDTHAFEEYLRTK